MNIGMYMNNEADEQRRYDVLRATEKLKLPAPRLQLTWAEVPGKVGTSECIYTLVIPLSHDYDIRREEGEDCKPTLSEWHARLGLTETRGGPQPWDHVLKDGTVATPYRDGAHALWDAEVLNNLPVYAVSGDKVTLVENKKGETK